MAPARHAPEEVPSVVSSLAGTVWVGTEGDLPGETVLQPSSIPVCHYCPSRRKAGPKTCAAAAAQSLGKPLARQHRVSTNTPLLDLVCYLLLFMSSCSSLTSPKCTEINLTDCTLQTTLPAGLVGCLALESWPNLVSLQIHTPTCQAELAPSSASHFLLVYPSITSLPVGKVSHYEALPQADHPIQ